MLAPRDLHPLLIALLEAWARRWGWDPADVWSWLARTAVPPPAFVAGAVEAFFPLVRESDFLLPRRAKHDTLDTVDASTDTRRQRVSRARLDADSRRHPFVAALIAKGMTVTELAAEIGYPRTSVQSWYGAGDRSRPIPRPAAEKVRDLLGVPLDAWRKVSG